MSNPLNQGTFRYARPTESTDSPVVKTLCGVSNSKRGLIASILQSRKSHISTFSWSDLMTCLEQYGASTSIAPTTDVKIIDGAALVIFLQPTKHEKTLGDYSERVNQQLLNMTWRDHQITHSCWQRALMWFVHTEAISKILFHATKKKLEWWYA